MENGTEAYNGRGMISWFAGAWLVPERLPRSGLARGLLMGLLVGAAVLCKPTAVYMVAPGMVLVVVAGLRFRWHQVRSVSDRNVYDEGARHSFAVQCSRNLIPEPIGIGFTTTVVSPTRKLKRVGPDRMSISATPSPIVRAAIAVMMINATLIAVSDAPMMNADSPNTMHLCYIAV